MIEKVKKIKEFLENNEILDEGYNIVSVREIYQEDVRSLLDEVGKLQTLRVMDNHEKYEEINGAYFTMEEILKAKDINQVHGLARRYINEKHSEFTSGTIDEMFYGVIKKYLELYMKQVGVVLHFKDQAALIENAGQQTKEYIERHLN